MDEKGLIACTFKPKDVLHLDLINASTLRRKKENTYIFGLIFINIFLQKEFAGIVYVHILINVYIY